MVPERDVDCADIYARERRRLVELLKSFTAEQLAERVPATPEWSVHDVLSHVVGITTDLNAQNFGTDAYTWTAAQVARGRNKTVDALGAEWEREGPAFQAGLDLLGYEFGSHYIGDLLQHVGDVRHALALPRLPDDESLAVALDFYLTSFAETLVEARVGAVAVTVGDEEWTLGAGATVASIAADRYELFRCLGGRRSIDQIRALAWTGNVDAVLPLVSRYPLPDQPIVEPA